MRKRVFLMILTGVLWCLLGNSISSYAASIESLEGKEFMVFMWCDDDAGDYCDEAEIVTEVFMFEDDDRFYLETFEDQGIATGNYDENGIFFEAEFEVLENLIEVYEFDITGLNIVDVIIVGRCKVSYEYIINFEDEEATCNFIGFPK
jgi:hypothetical protein